MEDGLLIMLLVFLFPANPTHFDRTLPVPSSHPQTGWSANTPRAARERVERFACARFAVGCWIESLFFHATLLFFLRQKRGRSRANGFLGMSEALRGQL